MTRHHDRRARGNRRRDHGMNRPTAAVAALTLASLAALTACNDSGDGTAKPTARPTSVKPTTTPSPTPSTSDEGTEAAEAAVVKLWATLDELSINPNIKLERLAAVARGQALFQWQFTYLRADRRKGWRQIGESSVVSASARHLANGPRYKVDACVDFSKVNVVDKQGKSVVAAERPARTRDTYTVEDTGSGWFVVHQAFKATTC
jgi:hypothetical protein